MKSTPRFSVGSRVKRVRRGCRRDYGTVEAIAESEPTPDAGAAFWLTVQ